MSTTIPKITAGLTVLGLLWGPATLPAAPPQVPAQATPTAVPPASAPTVLLLSDGRVVQGTIRETDLGYSVATPFGELPFRRRDVVQTFVSIQQVYQYKQSLVPERDPDERLRLAQWCVTQRLFEEARNELDLVLKLSPGLPQAKSMLFMIDAEVRKASLPRPDEALQRASAEEMPAGVPGTLNPSIIRELRDEYRRTPNAGGIPIIFDLPPAVAVKRYREFATFIHPALHRTCAQCHNEQSQGSFRLIQARARRDLENDLVIRANLDAVLPLVDPFDPEVSKLLTSAIMPHPPTNRPVLTGPNSHTYQLLANWVHGLKDTTAAAPSQTHAPTDAVNRTGFAAPAPTPSGGFAADRAAPPPTRPATRPAPTTSNSPAQNLPALSNTTLPPFDPDPVVPTPAGQIFPGAVTRQQAQLPPPSSFPSPALMGGPNQQQLTKPNAVSEPKITTVATGSTTEQFILLPDGTKIPVIDPLKHKSEGTPSEATPGDKDARKPSRIDPAILQKFMSGQPGPRP